MGISEEELADTCRGTRTGKRLVLEIIKSKSDCHNIDDRDCAHCPIGVIVDLQCVNDPTSRQLRYKEAIRYYVKKYGKDEDLVEILI